MDHHSGAQLNRRWIAEDLEPIRAWDHSKRQPSPGGEYISKILVGTTQDMQGPGVSIAGPASPKRRMFTRKDDPTTLGYSPSDDVHHSRTMDSFFTRGGNKKTVYHSSPDAVRDGLVAAGATVRESGSPLGGPFNMRKSPYKGGVYDQGFENAIQKNHEYQRRVLARSPGRSTAGSMGFTAFSQTQGTGTSNPGTGSVGNTQQSFFKPSPFDGNDATHSQGFPKKFSSTAGGFTSGASTSMGNTFQQGMTTTVSAISGSGSGPTTTTGSGGFFRQTNGSWGTSGSGGAQAVGGNMGGSPPKRVKGLGHSTSGGRVHLPGLNKGIKRVPNFK